MRKLAFVAIVLAGFGCVLSAAEPPADDDPIVRRFDVGGVDMARIPPAPRHLNAMLALLREGSVMVMLYQRYDFSALRMNELYDVELCVAARNARAVSLADRIWIITAHRVQFTPRNPQMRMSITEPHATVSKLSELLADYGDVKVE
ncbi:MAG TPA: hypothetical protein VKY89_16335 [Thermoanaerobaculia bacterium]|jgi:hypothetical protein|nr:hypothetical protein [Thermoanaerobaculia bacterium]